MLVHANVGAWQREEDGSYKSEVDGYSCHVRWRPEREGERRGFSWTCEGPDGQRRESDEVAEEIEVAMAHAERAARLAASGLA
jgi:hypothetical protein